LKFEYRLFEDQIEVQNVSNFDVLRV
jgi:hypothetical protein